MILSDKDIEERLIKPEDIAEAKKWWENGEWEKIGDKILINPFEPNKLGVADYDLSVGEEYILLRDPDDIKPLAEGQRIDLGPGETVLILTKEYVALPRDVMGFVVLRAGRLFEGSSVCASRIDPTWYGKLLVSFTNLAKFPTFLSWGTAFCTFYLMQSSRTSKSVSKREVKQLGRTKIGEVEHPHLRQRDLVRRSDVTETHIREVEETFGRPFDIVFGAIDRSRETIIEFIQREVAPKIAASATDAAVRMAFRRQNILMAILVGGLLTLIAGFLAYIWVA